MNPLSAIINNPIGIVRTKPGKADLRFGADIFAPQVVGNPPKKRALEPFKKDLLREANQLPQDVVNYFASKRLIVFIGEDSHAIHNHLGTGHQKFAVYPFPFFLFNDQGRPAIGFPKRVDSRIQNMAGIQVGSKGIRVGGVKHSLEFEKHHMKLLMAENLGGLVDVMTRFARPRSERDFKNCHSNTPAFQAAWKADLDELTRKFPSMSEIEKGLLIYGSNDPRTDSKIAFRKVFAAMVMKNDLPEINTTELGNIERIVGMQAENTGLKLFNAQHDFPNAYYAAMLKHFPNVAAYIRQNLSAEFPITMAA